MTNALPPLDSMPRQITPPARLSPTPLILPPIDHLKEKICKVDKMSIRHPLELRLSDYVTFKPSDKFQGRIKYAFLHAIRSYLTSPHFNPQKIEFPIFLQFIHNLKKAKLIDPSQFLTIKDPKYRKLLGLSKKMSKAETHANLGQFYDWKNSLNCSRITPGTTSSMPALSYMRK